MRNGQFSDGSPSFTLESGEFIGAYTLCSPATRSFSWKMPLFSLSQRELHWWDEDEKPFVALLAGGAEFAVRGAGEQREDWTMPINTRSMRLLQKGAAHFIALENTGQWNFSDVEREAFHTFLNTSLDTPEPNQNI